MTKLTMVFEEKDYGADLNVEFEGNVKDIASAFGSLEYELIKKLESNVEMQPGMSMPTVLMAVLGMGLGCAPVDSKRFRH